MQATGANKADFKMKMVDSEDKFHDRPNLGKLARNESTKNDVRIDEELNIESSEAEMFKRLKRLEKFEQQKQAKAQQTLKPSLLKASTALPKNGNENESTMDLEELARTLAIKGTCTQIEKTYFRLTSAPDPSEVRPEPVLRQALVMLKQKWAEQKADYKYIDDQFRSLR